MRIYNHIVYVYVCACRRLCECEGVCVSVLLVSLGFVGLSMCGNAVDFYVSIPCFSLIK